MMSHAIAVNRLHIALAVAIALALCAGQVRTATGEWQTPIEPPTVTPDLTKDADVVPGQIVVRFRSDVAADEQQTILLTVGATEQASTPALDATLAKVDPAEALRIQKELEGDPRILYAEPNYYVHATADTRTPNDPEFGLQWGLNNSGQYVGPSPGTPDADIDAPEAWTVTTGSSSVVVAVIDSGIDFSNPDLGGGQQNNPRMWINSGEDCPGCRIDGVDNDGNGYIDDWRGWDFANDDNNPFDDNGHGTHVAGIIGAGGDNGIGGSGVAWNVSLVALKFLDFSGAGTTFDAAEAITYAARMGYPITNNSWGGGAPTQVVADAIAEAHSAGSLFVAAAGNDGFNSDEIGAYPASYQIPNIIAVAASDLNDTLASFSNYGARSVDLAAPGKDIYSTWTGVPGLPFKSLSGTSMATPMVSGAAALLLSRDANADPTAIKALLMNSVDQAPALHGLVASNGRLNINNAVRCNDAPTLVFEAPFEGFAVEAGTPVSVRVLAGNCASATGVNVAGTVNGSPLALVAHGDGTYSTEFSVESTGPVALTVSAEVSGRRITSTINGAVVENYNIRNVPYEWIEPRATGGFQILMWGDDETRVLDLPFAVSYYGEEYNQLTVSTNGYVVFGPSPATSFANVELPNPIRPNGVVAPFWDDFNPENGGSIWWDVEGDAPNRRYVVAWEDVPHYDDIGGAFFEVIFSEAEDTITFQYQDVDFGDPSVDNGASATIGVEHPAGTVGRTFAANRAVLGDYQQHWGLQFALAQHSTPRITDFSLPQAIVSAAYSHVIQHEGGAEPLVWSIDSGELPPGLALNTSTGDISGSPVEAGVWEFEVRLTDANGQAAWQLLQLEVAIGYSIIEVPFAWIDARDGGADIGFTEDEAAQVIDLPFSFDFYGQAFDRLTVVTNGYVIFGESDDDSFINAQIPNPAAPNGYAAAFWDDLSPQAGGGVWYRTVGDAPLRKFVIAWYDAPRYREHGAATFEIVLEESTNAIEFHYLDTSFEFSVYDFGYGATIGIESPSGTSGTQFSYNEAVLQPYDGVTGLRFTRLIDGNQPPFITTFPETSAIAGKPWVYYPAAWSAGEPTWALLDGPPGMQFNPTSGRLFWAPDMPGDYPITLQVHDRFGSDEQSFTLHVTGEGQITATIAVAEGLLTPPGTLLSQTGTLINVQHSDDLRLEVPAGAWASFDFAATLPNNAVVLHATLIVEFHQSAGMPDGALTWDIAGGTLQAPVASGTLQPEAVVGAENEKAVSWDISEWITGGQQANDILYVLRNGSTTGSVQLDQIRLEVVYQEAPV